MPINISTSAAFFRWRPACWLRVTGDDAATFLQGQFTNDLRVLDRADAVYGLWLTVKGKVLADSFVMRAPAGGFWIGSYFSPAAVIRERLESYIIADDVQLEDATDEWAAISLSGAWGETALQHSNKGAALVYRGRRGHAVTAECVYPVADGEPDWVKAIIAGAQAMDDNERERRRIDAAIPAIPIDLGPTDLPNEAGLEADAISYTKGCYLGQEVMARLKSMGQVRRRLLRVEGRGDLPVLPAPVFAGARQVGELRSAARGEREDWQGLAMLTRMHVSQGAELSWVAGGAPALRVVDAS